MNNPQKQHRFSAGWHGGSCDSGPNENKPNWQAGRGCTLAGADPGVGDAAGAEEGVRQAVPLPVLGDTGWGAGRVLPA